MRPENWTMDLPERIEAALTRIKNGQAPMRIPVEETDPDVVLADCGMEIERLQSELAAVRDELETVRNNELAELAAANERAEKLESALRDIREVSSYQCASKHGYPIPEGHELKCAHARNLIRAEEALRSTPASILASKPVNRQNSDELCGAEESAKVGW